MESRKLDARGWGGISCPRPGTTGTLEALLPPRNGLGATVWAVDRVGTGQSRSSACKITHTMREFMLLVPTQFEGLRVFLDSLTFLHDERLQW